jgi:prepilin-type N-terminal cleavage/methylation domain-containing protein
MTRAPDWLGNQRGFTLAELLVVTAVIGLVMAGVFVVQRGGQEAYLLGSNRVETQQNARVALDVMTRELRSAESITTVVAGGTDITFVDQSANTIRYCWSSTATGCVSSGQRKFLNRVVNGTTTALIGGVRALTITSYSAYDVSSGTYTTTTTAAQVKVIKISLVTGTEESVAAGSPGDQRATMESTVKLRKYLSWGETPYA